MPDCLYHLWSCQIEHMDNPNFSGVSMGVPPVLDTHLEPFFPQFAFSHLEPQKAFTVRTFYLPGF